MLETIYVCNDYITSVFSFPPPVPRVLQPAQNGDHNAAHFTFEAAFLTAYHLYASYRRNFISNNSNRVRLGRLCRFSRTWQAVDSLPPLPLPSSCTTASHRELSNGRLHALPLPWAQEATDRQVMLFYGNKCLLLTLEAHTEPRGGGALAPVRTTLEQMSLLSMLSLPQEAIDGNGEANVISVEQAISTNWLQVVAQPERRAVLVLAQLAVGLADERLLSRERRHHRRQDVLDGQLSVAAQLPVLLLLHLRHAGRPGPCHPLRARQAGQSLWH